MPLEGDLSSHQCFSYFKFFALFVFLPLLGSGYLIYAILAKPE
jgi:hypothetical protein